MHWQEMLNFAIKQFAGEKYMLQHTAMLMFGFCLLFSTSAVHSKGGVMSLTLVGYNFKKV